MNFDETLFRTIQRIKTTPLGFADETKVIEETNYVRKLKFEPASDYSTTLGQRYCRLAYNWHLWPSIDLPATASGFPQMANLIHEAVHAEQRRRMTDFAFSRKWLFSRPWRYQLELEAYVREIQYAMAFFNLPAGNLRSYIFGNAITLANGYFLGNGYRAEKAFEDMMARLL